MLVEWCIDGLIVVFFGEDLVLFELLSGLCVFMVMVDCEIDILFCDLVEMVYM